RDEWHGPARRHLRAVPPLPRLPVLVRPTVRPGLRVPGRRGLPGRQRLRARHARLRRRRLPRGLGGRRGSRRRGPLGPAREHDRPARRVAMSGPAVPREFLAAETRALLARVDRLRPFVEQGTMRAAAVLLPRALVGIEELLLAERARLRALGLAYLRWLSGPGAEVPAGEQQRRYALLRLRLNDHLSTLDLFSDAVTQRSESEVGLW